MDLKIFLGKNLLNLKYPPYLKINFWKNFYKNPVYVSPIIITWVYLFL